MTALRSLLFNIGMVLSMLGTMMLMLALMPLPRRYMVGVVRGWTRLTPPFLRVMVGIRHEIRGRDNIPDGPAIYASKHQSAWDTMAMFLPFDDPAYVIKKELIDLPLYGWFARKCEVIGVDRKGGTAALRKMVADTKAILAAGRPVIIFPEGTRAAPDQHLKFHSGVAALYAQCGVPVVPVALNSGLFWSRRSFVKRPGRIVVAFLPPIAPGLDRKAFMAELQSRIGTATDGLVAEARERFPHLPGPEAPPGQADTP